MENLFDIKPGEGIGEFRFGTDINTITKVLGEPDETEILNDEEFETKIISYWEKGLTFFFEGENHTIFTCVEADNEELSLFGQSVIGSDLNTIVNLMEKNGYKETEIEEEEWGEKRLTYEDLALDFYFEEEELVSISWAILDDIEDEE